uniref:Uncharacterized protein n=1 Tax=Manihot esculenta TaxID=3983 RepID=A0A2C9WN67_MANES
MKGQEHDPACGFSIPKRQNLKLSAILVLCCDDGVGLWA